MPWELHQASKPRTERAELLRSWPAVVVIWGAWAAALLVATLLSERYPLDWHGCVTPPEVIASGAVGDGPLWPLRLWDYRAYENIANVGYGSYGQTDYAFFPLWPLILKAGAALGSAATLGTVVAVVASAFAFLGVAATNPSRSFRRTAVALACMPGSFALLLVYPDGLALAAGAWACYMAKRDQWFRAAGLALVATVARPNAFLLIIPLVYFASRSSSPRRWAGALAPIVGTGAVMAYFWWDSGTAFAFTRAQAHWDRGYPWNLPGSAFGHWNWVHYYQGFVAIFAIILCVLLWRRPRYRIWSVYATAVLAVSLGSGSVASIPRHMLFAFPLIWEAADGPRLIRNRFTVIVGLSLNVFWIFFLRCEFP